MNSRKRLIVTGAQGFVAGSVIVQAGAGWEVHALSRGAALLQREGLSWHRLDPHSPALLIRQFRELRPQAVIHTAALADIDFCQANPDLARQVNVGVTELLASLCSEGSTKLVFCSTDAIFDGEHAPYREEATAGPVNFYAETKVAAEKFVARLGQQAVIARLALVMGLPVLGAGNSFMARLVASLRAGHKVSVAASEVRTPIDVITLGRALLELTEGRHAGVIHLAGNDRLNRLEMSQRIAARLGLPDGLIAPSDPRGSVGRARRPRDVSLDNAKARAELTTPMPSFDEALTLVLNTAPRPVS